MRNSSMLDQLESKVESYLNQGRLSKAIALCENICRRHSVQFPELSETAASLHKLSETYRYMSEFMMQGLPDDSREQMYEELVGGVREILGNIILIARGDTPSDSYFEMRRLEKIHPSTLRMLVDNWKNEVFRASKAGELDVADNRFRAKAEEAVVKIFNKMMILNIGDRENLATALQVVKDPETPFHLASQIVAGLTLGALRFFDRRKLITLLDMYDSAESEQLQGRILTSIVLILSQWRDRINADKPLLERIEALTFSIVNYMRLRDVVMTIIRTRDTDRVNKKIKDSLEKDLTKLHRGLDEMRKNGNVLDPVEFGENPEWEKLMKDTGLEEKLQDINEMQLEGMDIMMQAFSNLKHFPFFRAAANWFLPFSTDHSMVERLPEIIDRDILDLMSKASDMCESDKYSFALGILSMPSDRVDMLASQMEAAREQMSEEMKEAKLKMPKNATFNQEVKSYLRDLYRFLKLYPARRNFTDVFRNIIDFRNLPGLGAMLSETEVVGLVGEFYFKYGYYPEALPLLEILVANGTNDRHIYEKIGYCHQVAGNHQTALENYEKADLFSTDTDQSSMWLIRKIALCNKLLHRYDRAAEYYQKALEREPENISLLLNLGYVLFFGGKPEEAKKYLSKGLYLKPDDHRIIRALAYTALKAGDNVSASDYISRLIADSPAAADWQIAAHGAFIAGDYRKAAEYYAKGLDNPENIVRYLKEMKEEMQFLQGDLYKELPLSIVLDTL